VPYKKGDAAMNLAKIGAIVIGGIVVFFILDSLVHVFLGLLGALLFVAVIAGGGYVAYKLVGGGRRREIRRGDRY
jgi:hypothetical protein